MPPAIEKMGGSEVSAAVEMLMKLHAAEILTPKTKPVSSDSDGACGMASMGSRGGYPPMWNTGGMAPPYGYPSPQQGMMYQHPGMVQGYYGAPTIGLPSTPPAAGSPPGGFSPHMSPSRPTSGSDSVASRSPVASSPVHLQLSGGYEPQSEASRAAPALSVHEMASAPSVRDVTQLGGPMKTGGGATPGRKSNTICGLSPTEFNNILDISTTEFNRFLKQSQISSDEVAELRKARRRKKNRLYAKRSRGKKLAKLLELQATVTQLSSAAKKVASGDSITDEERTDGSVSPSPSEDADNPTTDILDTGGESPTHAQTAVDFS